MNAPHITPVNLPPEVRASIEAQAPSDLVELTDEMAAPIVAKIEATASFDIAEAIAQGEAIAARSAEIKADPDIAADLAIMEETDLGREPVTLACFSPIGGKTNDAPLVEGVANRDALEGAVDEPARFPIALADTVTGPITRRCDVTWGDLAKMLGNVQAGAKDGPLWIAGDHPPGPRGNEHVRSVSVLALDVEARCKIDRETGIKTAIGPEPPTVEEMATEVELCGWRAILHTTYSHLDPGIQPPGVAHHRYRLVLALDRPLQAGELDPLGRHVASVLGIADCFDPSTLKPSQPLYLPRAPQERMIYFGHVAIDGDPLPVESLLNAARAAQDALRAAAGKRQGPQTASVIDTFNAAHDVRELLRHHGYIQKRGSRWLHPESSTGMAGVRLLPESDPPRVFSSHGCCPLNDGHAHDAFSIWCTLEHGGDIKTAVREAARLLGMEFERKGDRTQQEAHGGDHAKNQGKPSHGGGSAPAAPVSRLRRCSLSNLRSAALSPPAFVVEPLIPRGHLTLFGGHGGSGKTTVALTIGAHVACGRAWGGFGIQRGRVLIVSYEDPEELVLWRLRAIALEYQLPLPYLMESLEVVDATQGEAMMLEASERGIRRVVESADGRDLRAMIEDGAFDLVILDNASDCFGGNENDRQQVRHFVRFCANAVQAHNGAVLLLAHIDKNAARYGSAKNSYSGSTAWHNSARSRLALIDDELHQEKLNIGQALQYPVALTWKGPVPVPTSHDVAHANRAEEDDWAVVRCFIAAAEAGETVPAASTGPSTYAHVLTTYPECPEALKADKPRLKEAVNRLIRAGTIQREEYKNSERKAKQRLVLRSDILRQCAPIQTGAQPAQTGAPYARHSRIGGVGELAHTSFSGFGTGALAHSESPVFCADDIGGIVEGEV